MTDAIFEGLRVLEVGSGMAGPMVGMVLADHGADVVKVEPPAGDWARALPGFEAWNRGKRSIVVDLDSPAGRSQLHELAARADVVVAATRPGSIADRATASALRAHDALVGCRVTGFGPASGLVDAPAWEGVVAAATGRMVGLDRLSGGRPGVTYDRPAFTSAPVASYGAAQLAIQGIVAALLERERSGRGQLVETSLLEGAVTFLMRQELGRAVGDRPADQIDPATHRGIELCFITAECADGRFVQMCARQDRHFRAWLEVLGLGDLLEDPRFSKAPMGLATVEDGDELEGLLRERMLTRTQAEWMRVFTEEVDVGADPFLTPDEFLYHPDMVENGRVVTIDDPLLGAVRQVGPLVAMAQTPAVVDRPAPALGAHTGQVLTSWPARPSVPLSAPTEADAAPPLAGTTILEVAYYIAGPLATTLLAELGARVIKVEPLEGDPYRRTGLQSAKFQHGKESITLDLKHPDGQAVLRDLIRRCDALVHSFRGPAATRLGLDHETVAQLNPQMVYLYAGSYGSGGPSRHRAAFHSTPNALSGGGIKQAGRGNPPVNDSYADPGSALGAATALALGLWARHRTGQGQYLETTMLCSTAYVHSGDMVLFDGAPAPPVADAAQHGLWATYRLYRAADGWVFLAAVTDEDVRQTLQCLDLGQLAGDPRFASMAARRAHDEVLARHVADAVRVVPAADVVRRLTEVGVAAVVAHDAPLEAWLEEAGLLTPMEHPAYPPYWRLPVRVRFSRSGSRLAPAAAAGEHSRGLLAELGRDPAAIEDLLAAGVTSTPPWVSA